MTRAVLATINFAGVMSQQRVAGIDRYLRTLELPTEVDGTATVRRVEHGASGSTRSRSATRGETTC